MSIRKAVAQGLALTALLLGANVTTATGQAQRDEQFYYPGRFNWQFLGTYPEAARLFNAFDYGHAVLYERLFTEEVREAAKLEKEYRYLTTDLLVRPPRFAVVEEVVMPQYAKIAWRAKMMFDWAHLLHRQIYDAYADERLDLAERDALIERLTDYYLSNRKYAFTDKPKSMALMDEQYFSQTFRKGYPKFNGLIWAYHWLQVGLYEPLIEGRTKAEKKAGVQVTLGRFWSMLEDPPNRFPTTMPMTSAIAPRFSAAHPRAAVIFDNLHMTHDIISDVLKTSAIPTSEKGRVIDQQLDKLQDSAREVMSIEEWRMMADHMGGVGAMGGPATGLLREAPASVAGSPEKAPMGHGMGGMEPDSGRTDQDRSSHGALRDMASDSMPGTSADTGRASPGMNHGKDGAVPPGTAATAQRSDNGMTELHRRMMRDPVIRQRVTADTTMRRLMQEMMGNKSAPPRRGKREVTDSTPARPDRPAPEPSPEHEGHDMSDMPDR